MPDTTPVSPFAYVRDLGPRRRQLTILSYPAHYRVGDGWGRTREAFRVGSTAPWVAQAAEGVHTLDVRRDGLAVCRHVGHELAFRLVGLVGLVGPRSEERELLPVDLAAWSLDTSGLERGLVAWEGPHGARYEIRYVADGVHDRLALTDELRQAIGGALPAGASRFGLAFDCTMPPGLTRCVGGVAQTEHDTQRAIHMRGEGVHEILRPAALPDPRGDEYDGHAGWRERWRYRDGRLLQTVPLDALDHVGELRTGLTIQPSTEDAHILEATSTNNTGGHDTMECCRYQGGTASDDKSLLVRFSDLSSIPGGVTINSASLQLYFAATRNGTNSKTVAVARVKVAWTEGAGTGIDGQNLGNSCSWTYRDEPTAWATAGCLGVGDKDADEDSISLGAASSAFESWTVTQMLTDWYDGTYTNYGMVLYEPTPSGSNGTKQFATSENATSANRPKLTIDYTAGGGGRRRPVLGGGILG